MGARRRFHPAPSRVKALAVFLGVFFALGAVELTDLGIALFFLAGLFALGPSEEETFRSRVGFLLLAGFTLAALVKVDDLGHVRGASATELKRCGSARIQGSPIRQ